MTSQPSPHRLARRFQLFVLAVASLTWWKIGLGVAAAAAMAQVAERTSASRESYWNVHYGKLVYALLAVLVIVLAYGFYQRVRLWWLGKGFDFLDDLPTRLRNAVVLGVMQLRVPRDLYAGIMHYCIFVSIVGLAIVTAQVFIQDDFGVEFLDGPYYLAFSLYGDIFGFLGLIGVGMALYRRYISHYPRLSWDLRLEDHLIIAGLGLILVTGFLVEGLRIAADEIEVHPGWSAWSPGGWAVAKVFLGLGAAESLLRYLHHGFWWLHMPLSMGWLGLIAFTKLRHILFGPVNAFLRTTGSPAKLAPIADFEALERFGAGRIDDFTRKQLFELDACLRCGRCTDSCPAYIAGQPLSPMAIIQDLRTHLTEEGPALWASRSGDGAAYEPSRALVGEVIKDESLWACRTCGACVQECPVLIHHVPTIVDMRRFLVMNEARMPETAAATLMNMQQRGHPLRGTVLTRSSWMEGLDVPLFSGEQEYLLWVGCTGALSERNVPITQALARLLMQAGVSFGVLGEEEPCCGDPARRLGDEYSFQTMAQQSVEILKSKGVQKIITACPHGFHILKNEYPQFDGHFQVFHHTQILDRLVAEGRLRPKAEVKQRVVFHDSCYLGRQNDIYEQPRSILRCLPNLELVEMPRNRDRQYCCGAGGGNMWLEEPVGRRVNHVRSEEAMTTGARVVATACPFCVQMFEDGIPAVEPDEEKRMKTMDIVELLQASVAAEAAPAAAAEPESPPSQEQEGGSS